MGRMSARLDRVRPLLCGRTFMALRLARRYWARSVGPRRGPQANECRLLARPARLEQTCPSRRQAAARLLRQHGRRFRQQSADIMARRFVVADSLDTRTRLVPADEKAAEHPRHAAGGLGRGLAACLARRHDGEPAGSQSPHPAPRRDPGGGKISQHRAHGGAGRCRALAGATLRRQEAAHFLDHRRGRILAAAPARCIRVGSAASATRCTPPAPGSSSSRSAAITRSGRVLRAKARTRRNGRSICGCRTFLTEATTEQGSGIWPSRGPPPVMQPAQPYRVRRESADLSLLLNGAGPRVIVPSSRRCLAISRPASALPIFACVHCLPVGETTRAPFLRQRDASGISEVTHTSTAEICSAIQSSAASALSPTKTILTFAVPGGRIGREPLETTKTLS